MVYINPSTGFSILQASLAAAAHMAGPLGACFTEAIEIKSRLIDNHILLEWSPLSSAAKYQVWEIRGARWHLAGETIAPRWVVSTDAVNQPYRVFALTEGGCQSHADFFPLQ
jgi:hypothetical protein